MGAWERFNRLMNRLSFGDPPRLIDENFGWLRSLGFEILEPDREWMGLSVTYQQGDVLVRPSYDMREEVVDVTIARRRAPDLGREPYWAQVHLAELLELRAVGTKWDGSIWGRDYLQVPKMREAADLFRRHAGDLLAGENLQVLDEIVAARPRHGVPGLDFPYDKLWASSQEGVWFPTDWSGPWDMATCLDRSRSDDASIRALAALKIPIALNRKSKRGQVDAGRARLREMLDDPEPDVRRAAASALGGLSDIGVLETLLRRLADEPGDASSPIAAAVTFIALDADESNRKRVVKALFEFARRGAVATRQVDELAWRLGAGDSRGYPRVIQMWHGPDES